MHAAGSARGLVLNYDFAVALAVEEGVDVGLEFAFGGFGVGVGAVAAGFEVDFQQFKERRGAGDFGVPLFFEAVVDAQGLAVAGVRLDVEDVGYGALELVQHGAQLAEVFEVAHLVGEVVGVEVGGRKVGLSRAMSKALSMKPLFFTRALVRRLRSVPERFCSMS